MCICIFKSNLNYILQKFKSKSIDTVARPANICICKGISLMTIDVSIQLCKKYTEKKRPKDMYLLYNKI